MYLDSTMGSGASTETKKSLKHLQGDLDQEKIQGILEYFDGEEDGTEQLNAKLAELYEIVNTNDEPDLAILKIVKDEMIKLDTFEKSSKAKKSWKKACKKDSSVVMLKAGSVQKCRGEPRKITFLIGMGYGKGWCDLGPLNDEGSEYCVFKDTGDDDGEDDGDGEDDDGDEEAWTAIKTSKDGEGINSREFSKRKKGKKYLKSRSKKGQVVLLVNEGKIKGFTGDGDDGGDMSDDVEIQRQLTFMIGVAIGKGLIDDLGPLADDGPMAILEDDFDVDSDSE